MIHRIAIASKDGKVIDLHFVQAHRFQIYSIRLNPRRYK